MAQPGMVHPMLTYLPSDVRRWVRFTPCDVDLSLGRCQARTWGGGEGAQCKQKVTHGRLCANHMREISPSHGYINGDIPECKWKEFMANAAKRERARAALSSQ